MKTSDDNNNNNNKANRYGPEGYTPKTGEGNQRYAR